MTLYTTPTLKKMQDIVLDFQDILVYFLYNSMKRMMWFHVQESEFNNYVCICIIFNDFQYFLIY